MKKTILAIIGLSLLLGGCAGDYGKYVDSTRNSNVSQTTMAMAYFESDEVATKETIKALGDNEAAIALLLVMKKDKDLEILRLLRPEKLNAPTTANDVWKAVAVETIPTAVKWGVGYMAIDSIMGKVGTSYHAEGMSSVSVTNERNTLSDSPLYNDSYNTTITNEPPTE